MALIALHAKGNSCLRCYYWLCNTMQSQTVGYINSPISMGLVLLQIVGYVIINPESVFPEDDSKGIFFKTPSN